MFKKTAVLVVNPVNGSGLFQYLEAFFEEKIAFKTFAVSQNVNVRTNSGVSLITDDVVSNLKDKDYDALVFACGNAMPSFAENATKPYNQVMLDVINRFANSGKTIIGHCASALLFDNIEALKGKKVAIHPMVKNVVKNVVATDEKFVIDGNLLTAQSENTISSLLPFVIKALKD
jgi:putative intracellular protease/amidase